VKKKREAEEVHIKNIYKDLIEYLYIVFHMKSNHKLLHTYSIIYLNICQYPSINVFLY